MQIKDGVYINLITANELSTEILVELVDLFAKHNLNEFNIEQTGKIGFNLTSEKRLPAILDEIRSIGLNIHKSGME
ncbi:MAG: hypothetical protein KAX49_14205 [Halanaerobiales bacterium]|nr:hypothetical protein [Halanaerobiales bacterium]